MFNSCINFLTALKAISFDHQMALATFYSCTNDETADE
jgi:hypothetical protein